MTAVRLICTALVLANASHITPELASSQTFPSDDPVIRQMWVEGMEQSQTERLAQVLMDSIGPRLAGIDRTRDRVHRERPDYSRQDQVK